MKKIWLCFLIIFLVIGFLMNIGSVSFAAEYPIKVRIAHLFAEEHYLGQKMNWIAKELEKRSDGRFECEVFHGGIAGDEKENLEDILLGNIELMCGAGSYFAQYCPKLSIMELPGYGWKDSEEARKVARGYWTKIVEVAEEKGFYPVGLDIRGTWGVLYRKPIYSLDDLKRAKFRSVNSEYWIEITKLYGAIPNPLPYADAYMAFKQGVCDGVCTAVTLIPSVNWHEVLKCFIDTRISRCLGFTLTSKKWLDSLPDDLRKIVLEVGRDSDKFNVKAIDEEYGKDKEKMLKAGVVFIELDTTALKEKAIAFRDEYMKKKGPEVYKFYKDWLVYVEKTTGRPQH